MAGPDNSDFVIRQLETKIDAAQRQVDDLVNLLRSYAPEIIYAYDGGGTPKGYETLCRPSGSWLGSSIPSGSLQTYDTSVGSTAQISVTPGVVNDETNGNTPWTPTLGGTPINEQTGSPLAYPVLAVDSGATVAYLAAMIDPTTGNITALEIDTDTGGGVPTSTSFAWYLQIAFVTVSFDVSGNAHVLCAPTVLSSQSYAICDVLPLTDGNGYQNGPV